MIRITVECVDVRTGELVRTLKVDGKVDDLFSLQDRLVARAEAEVLSAGRRHESSITAAARRETESLEAYQAFSRGVMNLRLATPESLQRAIALFEEALGVDPRYASAWAALGTAYNLQGQFLGQESLIGKPSTRCSAPSRSIRPTASASPGLGAAYGMQGRIDEARRRCSSARCALRSRATSSRA